MNETLRPTDPNKRKGQAPAAFIEFRFIMSKLKSKLDSMHFESDKDCDAVADIEEELNEWGCRAFNQHDWDYDQCGYWQHQYCIHCCNSKYPDLARKSCGELTAQMGKMSEEEFLSANNGMPVPNG